MDIIANITLQKIRKQTNRLRTSFSMYFLLLRINGIIINGINGMELKLT